MFTDPVAAGRKSALVNGRVGNSQWGRRMLGLAYSKHPTSPISLARKAQLYKIILRMKLQLPLDAPIQTQAWRTWDGDPNSIVIPEDWRP